MIKMVRKGAEELVVATILISPYNVRGGNNSVMIRLFHLCYKNCDGCLAQIITNDARRVFL